MNKQPVYYMQTDSKWADLPYQVTGETATIGGSGCGPTCAAMLISTLSGQPFTPIDACKWSMDHGYKAKGHGTYYGYFTPQFEAFNLKCFRINYQNNQKSTDNELRQKALNYLKSGYYLIACMGRGHWTRSGHFIVCWWADNVMYINDPASNKDYRVHGDLDTFFNEVKYIWAIDAREYNREEEKDTMSYEQFKEYMDRYRKDLAAQPASLQSLLAEAKEIGLTDGSRPRDFATREEVAVIARSACRTAINTVRGED